MKKWLGTAWPLCLLVGCSVVPPKPYTPQNIDPAKPTYIIVGGWLSDWVKGGNGDLHEIVDYLERNGEQYIVAPVKTRNNQNQNSKIVLDAIQSIPGEVIIVSGSRGTAEVAAAISRLSPADKARIKLWLSISGAHLGSPVANGWDSILLRIPTTIWSNVSGWGPMGNIREMRLERSRARFREIELSLVGIPTVSVVTISSGCWQSESFKRIGCEMVDALGLEHDGLVLAQDQIIPGSKVITMRGHRHMLNAHYQVDMLRAAQQMVNQ